MALCARGVLLNRIFPLIQPKRFRAKINIQRPKPVHFDRAVFVGLTMPWFLSRKKGKKPLQLCSKPVEKKVEDEDNQMQRLIARIIRDRFYESRLIALYHVSPMSSDKHFKAFAMFKKANMHYRPIYGRKTVERAIKGTEFEAVLSIFMSQTTMVFSPEPEISELLKITKKFPSLVLLAAIYEGKFISKDELMALNLIPDLATAQAGLVHVMNTAACTLTQHLNSHQNTLVSHLQERAKQLEEAK